MMFIQLDVCGTFRTRNSTQEHITTQSSRSEMINSVLKLCWSTRKPARRSFGVRRGLCVRAALSFGGDQSSQSGAYAQTAPHSKYAVTRPEAVVGL